jgi:hypothetical protein
VQVQIAGCVSQCQNVSQVQQATQSSSTAQAIGTAAELANALETGPAPASTSQTTSTITQIQVGCLSSCFGTATSDPSTAALAQLLLSQVSSLQPPPGSSGLQPVPAIVQNVVQQAVCQIQETGAVGTQVQTASQTSTVIQVMPNLPAALGPAQPAGSTVDQTQQQIWQLQVGCLFYCVDTEQVQQAQQTTTTIQIVTGPPGSSSVTVVEQTIWQVQIGCLAWCWTSTQVQQAGTIAVVVSAVPPSGSGPGSGPAPGHSPAPGSTPAPAPAPEGSPAAASPTAPFSAGVPEAPAAPSTPAPARRVGVTATVSLVGSLRRTGVAILRIEPPTAVTTPPSGQATPSGTLPVARLPMQIAASRDVSTPPLTHPRSPSLRRASRVTPVPESSSRFAALDPGAGRDAPILVLMLAGAVAISFAAVVRRKLRR